MFKCTPLIVAAALVAGCGPSVRDGVKAYEAKDYGAAKKAFEGNADHRDAQYYLGEIYANGYAVDRDRKAAVDWYKKAADQAQPEAMYMYGWLLLEGKAVTKDVPAGLAMLEKAAETGFPRAYARIASYYHYEERKLPLAREFYVKGGNNIFALWGLAMLLESGGPGLQTDPVVARQALTSALENPDPKAPTLTNAVAFALAEYHYFGFGGPANFEKAFELAQKYGGNDNKAFASWMKYSGSGTTQNVQAAIEEWLRLDAEMKAKAGGGWVLYLSPYLPLGLALAYSNGVGVAKDMATAAKYEERLQPGVGGGQYFRAYWAAAGNLPGGCDVSVFSTDHNEGRYLALRAATVLEKARCFKKTGKTYQAYANARHAEQLGLREGTVLKASLLPALSLHDIKSLEILDTFSKLTTPRQ